MARPFFNNSYYQLKDNFRQKTEDYLAFLTELNEELNYREKPWPVKLGKEVRQQIERVQEGINKAMLHLPGRK